MAHEYNHDPERYTGKNIDRTYPSGAAGARPKLVTRLHCEPDPSPEQAGSESDNRVAQFNAQLRAGHGWRNRGEE